MSFLFMFWMPSSFFLDALFHQSGCSVELFLILYWISDLTWIVQVLQISVIGLSPILKLGVIFRSTRGRFFGWLIFFGIWVLKGNLFIFIYYFVVFDKPCWNCYVWCNWFRPFVLFLITCTVPSSLTIFFWWNLGSWDSWSFRRSYRNCWLLC